MPKYRRKIFGMDLIRGSLVFNELMDGWWINAHGTAPVEVAVHLAGAGLIRLDIRVAGHHAAPHISSIGSTCEIIRAVIHRYKAKAAHRVYISTGSIPPG
jgi:hypothetical protein